MNAEGYVVVLMKTLARALADGDTIQGVIRGIGLSSDGRGRSLWAPRKEGQLEAVRRAYGNSIDPQSVQYLEAHATSTQVGDATELEALAAFFNNRTADRKIPLGSVKSNIGHTLESAGLAGLVKCVLCMKEGLIPPTINLTAPNPTIDWTANPFVPVQALTPWPDSTSQPRRAAVNAFGIGGLNAHVIVDGPLPTTHSIGVTQTHPTARPTLRRSTPMAQQASTVGLPIAIVGRGLIVPGAFDIESFRQLLETGESQLVSPPPERWRDTPFSGTRTCDSTRL